MNGWESLAGGGGSKGVSSWGGYGGMAYALPVSVDHSRSGDEDPATGRSY